MAPGLLLVVTCVILSSFAESKGLSLSGDSVGSKGSEENGTKLVSYKFLPQSQLVDQPSYHHQSGLASRQEKFKEPSQSENKPAITTPAPRTALIAELVSASPIKGFGLFVFPLLIPFLLGMLAILFLPIQLLSAPIAALAGRRLSDDDEDGSNGDDVHQGMDYLLQHLLQSTDCVQRLSCEVGRAVKTPQVRSIIDQSFAELDEDMDAKWKEAVRGYVIGSNRRTSPYNVCVKFRCKYYKYFQMSD